MILIKEITERLDVLQKKLPDELSYEDCVNIYKQLVYDPTISDILSHIQDHQIDVD